jgi:hypothetical protein
MLDIIRDRLRINNREYDEEIMLLISSCKLDLESSGVASSLIEEECSLIKSAIILYCKANFGFDNADAEKFQKSYESLKIKLSLISEKTLNEEVN